jgi:hypothetical protein
MAPEAEGERDEGLTRSAPPRKSPRRAVPAAEEAVATKIEERCRLLMNESPERPTWKAAQPQADLEYDIYTFRRAPAHAFHSETRRPSSHAPWCARPVVWYPNGSTHVALSRPALSLPVFRIGLFHRIAAADCERSLTRRRLPADQRCPICSAVPCTISPSPLSFQHHEIEQDAPGRPRCARHPSRRPLDVASG